MAGYRSITRQETSTYGLVIITSTSWIQRAAKIHYGFLFEDFKVITEDSNDRGGLSKDHKERTKPIHELRDRSRVTKLEGACCSKRTLDHEPVISTRMTDPLRSKP